MTEELEGLLFTLEICRRELPAHAHPVHRERLDEIERRLKAERDVGKREGVPLRRRDRSQNHDR